MSKIHAAITAVNGYVPDYVLTNQELETMVDTNDEWIVTRTGIKERRILKGAGKATSDLAVPAVKGLLEKRGISAEEIELIIFCTSTADMMFPATANILADKIGAKNAWGYDLQAACSGFLFGLTTGAQFIESGKHKKVLVVGADKMSAVVNYQDRNTCILFGDGAGCVLLEPNDEGNGVIDAVLKTDGSGGPFLNIKGGGSLNPASQATVEAGLHYAFQEGRTVFKFAVTNMAEVAAEVMERNNLTSEDVNWLVPHQANKRIIDATAERAGLPEEKVMVNIHKYGNTTSATIPLCLWEWEDKLKKGDNLILAAFGGGFTWGSIYLKWAYTK
ncbi:beta-ketoacyl-ACP synthase III [Sphingobacterium wenxiniae]|uniref:Beta-ketoacyl-[acyl-carrier-protein] synthase III n=1 Tax=Sphingobacterium wenxiniae TaxID=683125 RepID=A0A1I6TVR4_9SPHI|nr:beta-ketoacyl-ACP synthase III [Sphingobacterium wenxiniae]SFS93198.1 3-oxoacyl-[acyl-carrier-protein] synthase-3 [Sphingobacterium wenxiniae]